MFLICLSINQDLIPYLLDHGASISETNKFGWTSLHQVVLYDLPIILSQLLAIPDVDKVINAQTVHGQSALHIAATTASATSLQLLLAAGANPLLVDQAGRTALEVTCILFADEAERVGEYHWENLVAMLQVWLTHAPYAQQYAGASDPAVLCTQISSKVCPVSCLPFPAHIYFINTSWTFCTQGRDTEQVEVTMGTEIRTEVINAEEKQPPRSYGNGGSLFMCSYQFMYTIFNYVVHIRFVSGGDRSRRCLPTTPALVWRQLAFTGGFLSCQARR